MLRSACPRCMQSTQVVASEPTARLLHFSSHMASFLCHNPQLEQAADCSPCALRQPVSAETLLTILVVDLRALL